MARTFLPPRNNLVFPRGFRKPAKPTIDTSHPISRGLVGCFMLGTSPNNVLDISASNNIATVNAGPLPLSPSHHGGTSNKFVAASSQYASFANNIRPGNVFTVLIWLNTANAANQTAIAQIDSSQTNATFYLRVNGNSGFTTGGANYRECSSPTISSAGWHLVALMYDGANLTYWLDGTQFSSQPFASLTPDVSASPGLAIGRLGASTGGYFDGFLDSARVYSRALSTAEHQQLFIEPYAGIYQALPQYLVGAGGGSPDITLALTGIGATASPGTLSTASLITLALTGLAATASPGTIAPARSVALTGISSTASPGSFGTGSLVTIGLTGIAVTATPGSVSVGGDKTIALTGTAATAFAGSLAASLSKALTGISITASPGSLAKTNLVTIGLTGNQAVCSAGTVVASGGTPPALWTPVVPGASTWIPTTNSTDIWTPQIPGSSTWTPQ